MRVRIDIGLDFDGIHTFAWEASDADSAVDVPRATLERWAAERESFKVAYLRWKHVVEEVDDCLQRAEQARTRAEQTRIRTGQRRTRADNAHAVAVAVGAKKSPASPHR